MDELLWAWVQPHGAFLLTVIGISVNHRFKLLLKRMGIKIPL
jgi:hypothetical protein